LMFIFSSLAYPALRQVECKMKLPGRQCRWRWTDDR
jgi:hypothetical protein